MKEFLKKEMKVVATLRIKEHVSHDSDDKEENNCSCCALNDRKNGNGDVKHEQVTACSYSQI